MARGVSFVVPNNVTVTATQVQHHLERMWSLLQGDTGAELLGVLDAAGYFTATDVETVLAEVGKQLLSNVIVDPGDAGAIAITNSGTCSLTSGALLETRTLADPAFLGEQITIGMTVDGGGDIDVTAASTIDQTGDTTVTFSDPGDFIAFRAIDVGGALVWRIIAQDGVVLS